MEFAFAAAWSVAAAFVGALAAALSERAAALSAAVSVRVWLRAVAELSPKVVVPIRLLRRGVERREV